MTDLANLLGDVYSGPGTSATPVRKDPHPAGRPEVPAWADDDKLDEVFADWRPGPGPDAPKVERHLMLVPPPAPSRLALDDDLAAALSAALVEATTPVTPPPAPAPAPAAAAAPPVAAPAPPPAAVPGPVAPPAAFAVPGTVMAPASVAVAPPREWQPGDDDITPDAGKRSRGRRFGRRR